MHYAGREARSGYAKTQDGSLLWKNNLVSCAATCFSASNDS